MDHNHHASGHIVVSGKRIKLKKQMSKSKQKGTMAETAVVQYLKQFWPNVERRALQGSKDTGDIAGIPNVVIEIKNHKNYNCDFCVFRNRTQNHLRLYDIIATNYDYQYRNYWLQRIFGFAFVSGIANPISRYSRL
jgi:hypothetical protein